MFVPMIANGDSDETVDSLIGGTSLEGGSDGSGRFEMCLRFSARERRRIGDDERERERLRFGRAFRGCEEGCEP